jgi:hypothetical protein
MLKIILAILLAMACAMGGNHRGSHGSTPTTYAAADSTSVSGGDEGHIHP